MSDVWQQPFAGEVVDAVFVLGCGTEVEDGGDDALVVFDADVLAFADGSNLLTTDTCCLADLVASDVQAATFGTDDAAEVSVAGAKIHFSFVFWCVNIVNCPCDGTAYRVYRSQGRYLVRDVICGIFAAILMYLNKKPLNNENYE